MIVVLILGYEFHVIKFHKLYHSQQFHLIARTHVSFQFPLEPLLYLRSSHLNGNVQLGAVDNVELNSLTHIK